MPEESLQKIFNTASSHWNMGSYDEFKNKIRIPNSRRKIYDALSTKYNMGEYAQFDSIINSQLISPTIKEELMRSAFSRTDTMKAKIEDVAKEEELIEMNNIDTEVYKENLKLQHPDLAPKIDSIYKAGQSPEVTQKMLNIEFEKTVAEPISTKVEEQPKEKLEGGYLGKGGLPQQAVRGFFGSLAQTGASLGDLIEKMPFFKEPYKFAPEYGYDEKTNKELEQMWQGAKEQTDREIEEFKGKPVGTLGYIGRVGGELGEFIFEMSIGGAALKPIIGGKIANIVSKIPENSKWGRLAQHVAGKAMADVPVFTMIEAMRGKDNRLQSALHGLKMGLTFSGLHGIPGGVISAGTLARVPLGNWMLGTNPIETAKILSDENISSEEKLNRLVDTAVNTWFTRKGVSRESIRGLDVEIKKSTPEMSESIKKELDVLKEFTEKREELVELPERKVSLAEETKELPTVEEIAKAEVKPPAEVGKPVEKPPTIPEKPPTVAPTEVKPTEVDKGMPAEKPAVEIGKEQARLGRKIREKVAEREVGDENIFFHGTSQKGAENIKKVGFIIPKTPRQYGISVSSDLELAEGYSVSKGIGKRRKKRGEVFVIKIKKNAKIMSSDEFRHKVDDLTNKYVRERLYPAAAHERAIQETVEILTKEGIDIIDYRKDSRHYKPELRILNPGVIESYKTVKPTPPAERKAAEKVAEAIPTIPEKLPKEAPIELKPKPISDKLLNILEESKKGWAKQEEIRKEDRAERVGKAVDITKTLIKKGKVKEAYSRSASALRGKYYKGELEKGKLQESEEIDIKLDIDSKAEFRYFDKKNAIAGIDRIIAGELPQPHQRKLLERMYGKEEIDKVVEKLKLKPRKIGIRKPVRISQELSVGITESIMGLNALFGGQTVGITAKPFSRKSYELSREHFDKAWENYKKAGFLFKEAMTDYRTKLKTQLLPERYEKVNKYFRRWKKEIETKEKLIIIKDLKDSLLKKEVSAVEQLAPELKEKLSEKDLIQVQDLIYNNTKNPDQAADAYRGLVRMMVGKVPKISQLEILNDVFGKEFTQKLLKERSFLRKSGDVLADLWNLPKSVRSSFDISALGRQGIILANPVTHPVRFWNAFKADVSTLLSKKSVERYQAELENRKYAEKGEESGLYQSPLGEFGTLTKMEEAFPSRWGMKIPGLKQSERAFITTLNKIRADAFDTYASTLEKHDAPIEVYKTAANLVNVSSGRGILKKGDTPSTFLNTIFWSPRLIASRVQVPYYSTKLLIEAPYLWKEVSRDMVGFAGYGLLTLTLLYLGGKSLYPDDDISIEKDPRSSDFGKTKIGNTRIDPWASYQPIVRYIAQIITGQAKQRGGKIVKANRWNTFTRFLRSKESPSFAFVHNLLRGKDFLFNDYTAKGFMDDVKDYITLINNKVKEGIKLGELPKDAKVLTESQIIDFVPLVIVDILDGIAYENFRGLILSTPAIGGVGVQTYEPRKIKKSAGRYTPKY